MSGRTRRLIALALAQVLVFTQTYAATTPAANARVLREVALKHMRTVMAQQTRMTEPDFVAARDKMLADIDKAIARLAESKLPDRAIRARMQKRMCTAQAKSQKELARYVRERMSAADVEQALATARSDGRYSRAIARHRGAREALLACILMYMRTASVAAGRTIATKTKVVLLADLQAARSRVTALAYDGSDYDEFFEFSWYVWHSDDALIWVLSPAMFVADILLTPVVFAYKMAHWLFID